MYKHKPAQDIDMNQYGSHTSRYNEKTGRNEFEFTFSFKNGQDYREFRSNWTRNYNWITERIRIGKYLRKPHRYETAIPEHRGLSDHLYLLREQARLEMARLESAKATRPKKVSEAA